MKTQGIIEIGVEIILYTLCVNIF